MILTMVCIAGAAPFAYISHLQSSNVSVIDTATNTFTGTVKVGFWPVGVAVTSDGKKVYVANGVSSTVSVIDAGSNAVVASVPVGIAPEGVSVTQDGTKVYVANQLSDNVSVIDTTTNNVTATVNVGNYPAGIAVTPDGSKVYVVARFFVLVINTATNTVVAGISSQHLFPVAIGQFIEPPFPILTVNKSAAPKNYSIVGQNITYTYNVTNSGNVNILGPIKVTDSKTGIVQISNSGLTPGQNVTGTANYTITQDDLNNGSVTNSATAKGTFGTQTITSKQITATVTANQTPALLTVKIAAPATYNAVGQNITYTCTVNNTGNVGISAPINVTDNRTGLILVSNSGLSPSQNVTGIANYTITQSDLDNGSVTNSAFASGTFNGTIVNSPTVTATATAVQSPALKIQKTANPANYSIVGQNITYTYNVINSGNVNILGPIKVTDNRTGIIQISNIGLSPGQNVTGIANYTITQSDLDNGSVTNSVFASGTFNGTIVNSPTVTATATAVQSPALKIQKTANPANYSIVGQNITYTYNVINTGNVNILGPIKVTDNRTGIIQISNIGLSPGQSATGTDTYTIKQADLAAGSVSNSATATGTFNGNTVTSNQVTVTVTDIHNPSLTVTDIHNPALTVTKTATPPTYNAVGKRITYRYTITNTGNVPVSSIAITDNKTTVAFSSGVLINGNLAPGSSLGGIGIYTIKQADLTAGSVSNSATATGTFNGNTVTSNQATVTVKYNK